MEDEIIFKVLTSNDLEQYKKVRISCLTKFPDNFGTTTLEEIASSPIGLLTSLIFHVLMDLFMELFDLLILSEFVDLLKKDEKNYA